MVTRLHIGGVQPHPDWKILNVTDGSDYMGDCRNLSQFADNSIEQVYASHVLEHLGYMKDLPHVLSEIHRILVPQGTFYMSVPDLSVLSELFIDSRLDLPTKFHVARMIYGGQIDCYDFHYSPWTWEFAYYFLKKAGFSGVNKVEHLGIFNDTSELVFADKPISLNIISTK